MQIPRPHPDLQHQNQHFHKITDGFLCTLTVGCAALDPNGIPKGGFITSLSMHKAPPLGVLALVLGEPSTGPR